MFTNSWLSLICHIFLYFLIHTKRTCGPAQWFLTFLFHTCYWPTPGSTSPVFSCDHDSPLSLLLAHIMKLHPRPDHLDLILQPWRWKQSIPPKRQYLPTTLHGIKTMHTTCEKLMPRKCRNLQILRWCIVWQGLLKQNDRKRRVPVTYWSNCNI